MEWTTQNRNGGTELHILGGQAGSTCSMRFAALLSLLDDSDHAVDIPVDRVIPTKDGFQVEGKHEDFEIVSRWVLIHDITSYYDVHLEMYYTGSVEKEAGLRIGCDLLGGGKPDWMIPGAFYKENRFEHNFRKYPRYDYHGGKAAEMVSDHWSFRSDRAALPAVFAWNDGMCGALCTDEVSPIGLSGLGFRGNAEGTQIWLDFPYREEPVTFVGEPVPDPADVNMHSFKPGEQIRLKFKLYAGASDPHAYDPFVRQMYKLHQEDHALNPWIGLKEAGELTAHGLYTWHYREEYGILNETAAFDREFNNNVKQQGDRPHMHVGWVSGAPYAYALLAYGRKHGISRYIQAAHSVLSKVASGIAPNGTFWASWIVGKGWTTGWNPKSDWLQARTIAEATLFMIRALVLEQSYGDQHKDWEQAVLSNLDFAEAHQREDGNFGSYYHCESGRVEEWDGAGGMLWIAALLEGAQLFGNSDYKEAAVAGGAYYESFIINEYIYGAPEDVHLTPTSEDAYNAVVSYVLLYEHDKQDKWLDLAKSAADWMMTFRWTYNLDFPKFSFLGQYDFKSRGADQASTSNQHLHNYGLFCVPEMLRLWRYSGDDYYKDRTRDHIACFLQFVAREDGDFNAYKGMVTERFYNTNCFQPKGMMLTLSHAWCVGLVLYASQEAMAYAADLDLPL